MKKLGKVFWVLACISAFSRTVCAQLSEIDPAKLPHDAAVQSAYVQLLPIEHYGQSWTNDWKYDVPKKVVVDQFTTALSQLVTASERSPDNHELQLLTGLVAHFAYNLDVDSSWATAVNSLQKAAASDPKDYRASWFLGMHQCQATDNGPGMTHLLGVEDSVPWQKLPIAFWNDYATCSVVTMMPAHGLRAIMRAESMGAPPSSFRLLTEIENKRFLASDVATFYTAKQAWSATKVGKDIDFTSNLCGVAVTAHENWETDVKDVTDGQCAVVFNPPAYKARKGKSSPSLLLMTRSPKPGESLSDFVQVYTTGKFSGVTPLSASCPTVDCIAFDIKTNEMYANQGGAHLQLVAFERNMPAFDGLIYEHPVSVHLDASKSNEPQYFRPDEVYHRLQGKRYFLLILDSNGDIFDSAKKDFDFFVGSVRAE